MTVVDAPVRLGIEMDALCSQDCQAFTEPLFEQMSSGKYDECATMPLPRNVEAWEAEHRTARKRAWKAQHLGYRFSPIELSDNNDAIWNINLSREYRQGRPMSANYHLYPDFTKASYPCPLHAVRAYGIHADGEAGEGDLAAYLIMYRAGDLALVSQVLGHAAYEADGIMYLLFREALAAEGSIAPGVCVYNRWDSGTDGLRFLKARIGFEPTAVEWLP